MASVASAAARRPIPIRSRTSPPTASSENLLGQRQLVLARLGQLVGQLVPARDSRPETAWSNSCTTSSGRRPRTGQQREHDRVAPVRLTPGPRRHRAAAPDRGEVPAPFGRQARQLQGVRVEPAQELQLVDLGLDRGGRGLGRSGAEPPQAGQPSSGSTTSSLSSSRRRRGISRCATGRRSRARRETGPDGPATPSSRTDDSCRRARDRRARLPPQPTTASAPTRTSPHTRRLEEAGEPGRSRPGQLPAISSMSAVTTDDVSGRRRSLAFLSAIASSRRMRPATASLVIGGSAS